MNFRRVLSLGLALSALAGAAPQRYEMRSYVNVGGKVRPAFAWCDAPDRVLAVTQPTRASATPQPVTLVRWLKRPRPESDAASLTAPYRLGQPDPGAGQIYTPLLFPDGTGTNGQFFVQTSNVENVNDPAYRMTRVNRFRTPEGEFGCRSVPQAVFLGTTARRTVIVWESHGKVTYATRNFDGTPGVYVTGGRRTESVEGGALYEFTTSDGFSSRVAVDAYGPGTGGVLSVSKGQSLKETENFLAYSVSRPTQGRRP